MRVVCGGVPFFIWTRVSQKSSPSGNWPFSSGSKINKVSSFSGLVCTLHLTCIILWLSTLTTWQAVLAKYLLMRSALTALMNALVIFFCILEKALVTVLISIFNIHFLCLTVSNNMLNHIEAYNIGWGCRLPFMTSIWTWNSAVLPTSLTVTSTQHAYCHCVGISCFNLQGVIWVNYLCYVSQQNVW